MTFQPVPTVWKHEVFWRSAGVQAVNVLHTIQVGTTDLTGAQAAAEAVRTAVVGHILPLKGNNVSVLDVVTTDLTVEGGVQAVASGTDTRTGASDPAPSQICAVVQLQTPIRGRSYRGRVFDPFYYGGNFAPDGSLIIAERTAIITAWNALRAELATSGNAGGALCVVSRTHNGVPRSSGIFTFVTAIGVSHLAGIQRRRRNSAA